MQAMQEKYGEQKAKKEQEEALKPVYQKKIQIEEEDSSGEPAVFDMVSQQPGIGIGPG